MARSLAFALAGSIPSLFRTFCLVSHSPSPASFLSSGKSHAPVTAWYSTSSSNHISHVRLLSPPFASFTSASNPATSSTYSCVWVSWPHCRLSLTSSTQSLSGSEPDLMRRLSSTLSAATSTPFLRMRRFFRRSISARRSIDSSAWFIDFCAALRAFSFRAPNRPPPGTFVRTMYSNRFRFHSSRGTTARMCGVSRRSAGTSSVLAPS